MLAPREYDRPMCSAALRAIQWPCRIRAIGRALVYASFISSMLVSAAACDDDSPAAFVFTPVPYTVFPAQGEGTAVAIALTPKGDRYVADEVIVGVADDSREEFSRWIESNGFSIVRTVAGESSPDRDFILVKVPLGSVPEAMPLIESQDGVLSVDYHSFFVLQE